MTERLRSAVWRRPPESRGVSCYLASHTRRGRARRLAQTGTIVGPVTDSAIERALVPASRSRSTARVSAPPPSGWPLSHRERSGRVARPSSRGASATQRSARPVTVAAGARRRADFALDVERDRARRDRRHRHGGRRAASLDRQRRRRPSTRPTCSPSRRRPTSRACSTRASPGVAIMPTTGRLGAGPSIQIRGRSSLSLGNSPLIYIDGVRVNNATGTGPSARLRAARRTGLAGRAAGSTTSIPTTSRASRSSRAPRRRRSTAPKRRTA